MANKTGDVFEYMDKLVAGMPSVPMVFLWENFDHVFITPHSSFLNHLSKDFGALPVRKLPRSFFVKWYPNKTGNVLSGENGE